MTRYQDSFSYHHACQHFNVRVEGARGDEGGALNMILNIRQHRKNVRNELTTDCKRNTSRETEGRIQTEGFSLKHPL